MRDDSRSRRSGEAAPVLEFAGVGLSRDGRRLLRDVCWTIHRGEHWAVLGANGSGKTMLLSIAAGYLWPTEGSVSILGRDYGDVDLRELRQRIGWVSSALHDRVPGRAKVLEVVLSGADASLGVPRDWDRATTERGRDLLRRMGLADAGAQRFGTLSQGERQRVLVARSLMAEPDLLVLDEVCSALDLAARESVLGSLGELAADPAGPTLAFVTHHVEEIVPAFSHALVLRGGSILAAGPRERALTSETLSEALGVRVEIDGRDGRLWPRVVPVE